MENKIFSETYVSKDMDEARKNVYNAYDERRILSEKVKDSVVGLDALFDSIRKTHEISQFDSASGVKGIKEDYDKIAYLIENFVDKFKPMYEEVYARYTAEVLAGSYEKQKTSTLGIDSNTITASTTGIQYFLPNDAINKVKKSSWNRTE